MNRFSFNRLHAVMLGLFSLVGGFALLAVAVAESEGAAKLGRTSAAIDRKIVKTIPIDYTEDFREAARLCETHLAEGALRLPQPDKSLGKCSVIMALVTFKGHENPEQVLTVLKEDGWALGNVIDLVRFMSDENCSQSKFRPIVALGSESRTNFERGASPAAYIRIGRSVDAIFNALNESETFSYLVVRRMPIPAGTPTTRGEGGALRVVDPSK